MFHKVISIFLQWLTLIVSYLRFLTYSHNIETIRIIIFSSFFRFLEGFSILP